MKTIQIWLGCRARNCRTGFKQLPSEKTRHSIRLACVLLVTLTGFYVQAAETAYKLFGREVGGYSSKDDVPGIVKRELGARASVADWDEIKKQYGQNEVSLKAFCERIGLAPEASACVTVSGKRFWQEQRQYFIYRADHKKPEDFLLHDQLQNDFLLLGSWADARPVLVKITGFNADDAAKWAKWDKTLKEANEKDISGVYTLVAVGGKKVPGTVSHEGNNLQVRSGSFTIGADGKCTSKLTFVPPSGSESTMEVKATSTREGPKLKMHWEGAGTTSGTVVSNTFTMENEGMVFVYRK